MKKFSFLVLAFFAFGILSACTPQTQNSNGTQQTSPQPSPAPAPAPQPVPQPSPAPKVSASGIRGTATIGPSCPVERIPPDPNCADKPYSGSFNVSTESGAIVKNFQTGADGSFEVSVPAGTYVISLGGGKVYPRMSPPTVTVEEGKFVSVHLELDSGIR